MICRLRFHALVAPLPVLVLLSLAGCAVPLGPGYQIERQQTELRYVAAPPQLQLRATYRLRNIGNREISFIEAELPSERLYGRQSLRVRVDGREVAVQPAPTSQDAGSPVRIPFDAWPQNRRRDLVIEYTLAPPPPGRANLAVTGESFHVRDAAALPLLLPPKAGIIKRGKPVQEAGLDIFAPSEFRVLSGGHSHGSRKGTNEIETRVAFRPGDYQSFVVAGRYQEQTVQAGKVTVLFWTFEPLDPQRAQAAAGRIAAAFRTYQTTFGPLWKNPPPIRFIEVSSSLTRRTAGAGDPAAVALPAGALLNHAAFALGVSSDAFLDLVEHELAHTWFGETVSPWPRTEPVLGEGLAEYAKVVAAEARSGDAERRHQAGLLLRWFDESRKQAADPPLLQIGADDPYEQRVFGYTKGALFFLALEDRYGKDNVRRALAHMVASLRGSEVGYAELRAALEIEAKQSLADFFRLWLDGKGIPEDFRARYEQKIEPRP